MDYITGLVALTGASSLDMVVSLAQLVLSPDVRMVAIAASAAACAGGALLLSALFAGVLGSAARGAQSAAGFPARPGMGFASGYARRFAPLAGLLFCALLALTALLFAWLIASIPIAVVTKAAESGVLPAPTAFLLAAITLIVLYAGFMTWRVASIAMTVALYSEGSLWKGRAWPFIGSRFFAIAGKFFACDIALAAIATSYSVFGKAPPLLAAAGVISGCSMAYLAFAAMREYAVFCSGGPARKASKDGKLVVGSVVFDEFDESAFEDYDDPDYIEGAGPNDGIGVGETASAPEQHVAAAGKQIQPRRQPRQTDPERRKEPARQASEQHAKPPRQAAASKRREEPAGAPTGQERAGQGARIEWNEQDKRAGQDAHSKWNGRGGRARQDSRTEWGGRTAQDARVKWDEQDDRIKRHTLGNWDEQSGQDARLEWVERTGQNAQTEWDERTGQDARVEWDEQDDQIKRHALGNWDERTGQDAQTEWDERTGQDARVEWDEDGKRDELHGFNNRVAQDDFDDFVGFDAKGEQAGHDGAGRRDDRNRRGGARGAIRSSPARSRSQDSALGGAPGSMRGSGAAYGFHDARGGAAVRDGNRRSRSGAMGSRRHRPEGDLGGFESLHHHA